MSAYSVRDAARILKVTPSRLRYWKRTRLVRSPAEEGDIAGFDFQDLVSVRAVLALLENGVPLQRIRQSIEILRDQVPELEQPLSALQVWGEAPRRVVVRHEGRLLEPDGQFVLEFESEVVDVPANEVAPFRLAPDGEPVSAGVKLEDAGVANAATLSALDWFEVGCGLDSDSATYSKAVAAYRNAVAIDPEFADAHCNLGAALYNKGNRKEAQACFERCLELQPNHVEGHFNAANLLEEEGEPEQALKHYKIALDGDPSYADLHINLALLYEKLEQPERGRDHWRRYLQIEPDGALAEIARERIGRD